jgi:hypothetical protein
MSSVVKGKRGRPRKSIWDHFTKVSTSSNDNNEAGSSSSTKKRPGVKCNYCKLVFLTDRIRSELWRSDLDSIRIRSDDSKIISRSSD